MGQISFRPLDAVEAEESIWLLYHQQRGVGQRSPVVYDGHIQRGRHPVEPDSAPGLRAVHPRPLQMPFRGELMTYVYIPYSYLTTSLMKP